MLEFRTKQGNRFARRSATKRRKKQKRSKVMDQTTYLLSAGGQRRKISRLSGRLEPYMRPIHESDPERPYLLHMLLRSVSLSRSQQPIITSLTELRSRNPSSSVTEPQLSVCCCVVYLPTKPVGTVSSGLAVSEKSTAEAVLPSWTVFNGLHDGLSHTNVPHARSTRANTNAVLVVPPSQSQCTSVVPWCNTWWSST